MENQVVLKRQSQSCWPAKQFCPDWNNWCIHFPLSAVKEVFKFLFVSSFKGIGLHIVCPVTRNVLIRGGNIWQSHDLIWFDSRFDSECPISLGMFYSKYLYFLNWLLTESILKGALFLEFFSSLLGVLYLLKYNMKQLEIKIHDPLPFYIKKLTAIINEFIMFEAPVHPQNSCDMH